MLLALLLPPCSDDTDAGCIIATITLERFDRSASNSRSIYVMMVFKSIHDSLVRHYLSSMFTERIESGYAIRDSASKLEVLLPRTG